MRSTMSGSVNEQGKTGMAIERKDTRWKPGQSGNLAGRPLGTRNRFSENFVSDVAAVWQDRGRGILEKMAQDEPARFAELCGRLIPKDVSLTISERLPGGLDADDWQLTIEILRATHQALPDAGDRKPGEVLSFVLDAIRAHNAKAIDSK